MKKFLLLILLLMLFNLSNAQNIYDGSGRQIGRADGLRRMQKIIFFYFFM